MNTLSLSWMHYECAFFLAYSSWIDCLFREFTMNTLSISRFHFEFTFCFANSLYINNLFREFGLNKLSLSRIHYLFREFTMHQQLFLWIWLESTIFFAKSQWILLFRRSAMISLSHNFTFRTATSLWIDFLFREFTM